MRKIHSKNEFVKLTAFLAPTIEIPPVESGTTRKLGVEIRKVQFIANGKASNVENHQSGRRGAVHGPSISPAKCHQEVMDHKQAGAADEHMKHAQQGHEPAGDEESV